MPSFFLPELKINRKTATPAEAGSWSSDTAGDKERLLETLPQDLAVGEDKAGDDIISAVPTIFARPWLFAQVLFAGKNHPLFEQIRGEWRGLLALFCFKNALQINLQAVPYRIPEEFSDNSPTPQIFEKILNLLLPSEYWRTIYLLKVEDRVVGATSPITAFFTPAQYQCPKDIIPWSNQMGRLTDPTPYFKTQKEAGKLNLQLLKTWLKNLIGQLTQTQLSQESQIKIAYLLQEWQDELEVNLLGTDQFAFQYPVIPELPYSPFSQPIDMIFPSRVESDIFLDLPGLENPPLLICAETLREGITLYHGPSGHFTGDMIKPPSGFQGERLETNTGRFLNVPWIRPELLFSRQLLKLGLTSNTWNHRLMQNIPSTYTLPFSEEFFKFFDLSFLEKNFRLTQSGEKIIAALSLPLKKQKIQWMQIYDPEKIRKFEPDINPVLEAWPNFSTPDWKLYYLFYKTFEPIDTVSLGDANDRKKLSLQPLGKVRCQAGKGDDHMVWELESFPELINCRCAEQTAGIILLTNPQKETGKAANFWTVGFDFGTSNTNVFYKENHDIRPLALHDHYFQITDTPPGTREETVLFKNFFPPRIPRQIEEIKPDFPTLFLLTDREKLSGHSTTAAPTEDIAYLQPLRLGKWLTENLKPNLKWLERAEERKWISSYLRHLLIMLAAEAKVKGVREIEIRWSYPSAFKKGWILDMHTMWNNLVTDCMELTGIDIKVVQPAHLKDLTESVAMVKYFVEAQNASPAGDNPGVFIDIGGGTTDIGIWRNNNLMFQTSIKLAGNDIISEYAKKDRSFREELVEVIFGSPQEAILADFDREPASVVNALIGKEEDYLKLKSALATGLNISPSFKSVRTLIFSFLAGIMFYVGRLLQHAELKFGEFNEVEIWIGGKASRMADWVGEIQIYQEILKEFVLKGANQNLQKIEINFSRHPKAEVGMGLVIKRDFGEFPDSATISGEDNYLADGDEIKWNSELNEELFTRIQPAPGADSLSNFPWFNTFFNLLKEQIHEAGGLNSVTPPPNFRGKVQEEIYKCKTAGGPNQDFIIQPLFILELKVLLKYFLQN